MAAVPAATIAMATNASSVLGQDGYIFVYQDVRGCYMSEGQFVNMRPHIDSKSGQDDIDESSDTFNTSSLYNFMSLTSTSSLSMRMFEDTEHRRAMLEGVAARAQAST